MEWFSVAWRVLLLCILARIAFGKWPGVTWSVNVPINVHNYFDDDDDDEPEAATEPDPVLHTRKPDLCPSKN